MFFSVKVYSYDLLVQPYVRNISVSSLMYSLSQVHMRKMRYCGRCTLTLNKAIFKL